MRLFTYGILAHESMPKATIEGYELLEDFVYGRYRAIRPKEGSVVRGRLREFHPDFDRVEGPSYTRVKDMTTDDEPVWVYVLAEGVCEECGCLTSDPMHTLDHRFIMNWKEQNNGTKDTRVL